MCRREVLLTALITVLTTCFLLPSSLHAQAKVLIDVAVNQSGFVTGFNLGPSPVAARGSSTEGAEDGGSVTFYVAANRDTTGSVWIEVAFGTSPFKDGGKIVISDLKADKPFVIIFSPATVPNGEFSYTVTVDKSFRKTGKLKLFNDTRAPSCKITKRGRDAKGRRYIEITVQDQESGLDTIDILLQDNADIAHPGYTVGTTNPIIVRATKVYAGNPARVELKVTDWVGNARTCDPILTEITRSTGKPVTETFTRIPHAESVVTIYNGSPGLQHLELIVNGSKFKLSGLLADEERSLDVSSAMIPGDQNILSFKSTGKPGASAAVLIWDGITDFP